MKVVGELFGNRADAIAVRAAKRRDDEGRVQISGTDESKKPTRQVRANVWATVKGDVHDIGKNLVDIILTNNGYTVFNLGIKQPLDEILKAAKEKSAHAIGMSGLLA